MRCIGNIGLPAAQSRGDVLVGPASDRAEVRAQAEALFQEAEAERVAEESTGA